MSSSKTSKLEDQAATTALYSTKPEKSQRHPLDEDNKLSSASAATSLKYATPRDLPSFPSAGLTNPNSSAGAAASLANANHTEFEHWKPDSSASANKAAYLAKDYKAPPLWHPDPSASANKAAHLANDYKPAPPWRPEASLAGLKAANLAKDYKAAPTWHPETSSAGLRAATIAATDSGNVQIWHPEANLVGTSAAGQAMRTRRLSPQVDYGYTAEGNRKALLAATGAMSSSRKRAGSSPVVKGSYLDPQNSAANALSAANFANKPPTRIAQPKSEGFGGSTGLLDGAKIHNAAVTNLSREMYTSHPPVAQEVEEKNRQVGLRAAAVSMAKQMYDVQQRAIERATAAASPDRSDSHYAAHSVHNRKTPVLTDDSHQSPNQYVNLQEAAQKLATERLAKLQDEHAAYKNYYGSDSPRSRLSMRGLQRRRASSDGQAIESDEDRSRRIRSEMSMFNNKVAQIDASKRQKDRDTLLAAAQKNVRYRMHGLDEKVYAETGKVSPSMMQSWEEKAQARAEADSKARMANHGMVNIGGGMFLDQSKIDAIAAQKVQPTLDEITEKAEKQRARDEQLRLEEQERNRIAAAKVQDDRDRSIRTKEEWKRFKGEEKREAKAKKDDDKAKKGEEKRLRDEEKRKSKRGPGGASPPTPEVPALEPIYTEVHESAQERSELADTESKLAEESGNLESATASASEAEKEPKTADESRNFETGRALHSEIETGPKPVEGIRDLEPADVADHEANTEPKPAGEFRDLEPVHNEFDVDSRDKFIAPELRSRESAELQRVLANEPTELYSISGESDNDEGEALVEPERVIAKNIDPELREAVASAPSLSDHDAEIIAARVLFSPEVPDKSAIEAPISNAVPESTACSESIEPLTKETAELSAPIKQRDPTSVITPPPAVKPSPPPPISPSTKTTISGPTPEPKSPRGDSLTSWFKSKFSRRAPKPEFDHPGESSDKPASSNDPSATAPADESSLNRGKESITEYSSTSTSCHDNAARGQRPELGQRAETSSSHGDDQFEEARDHFEIGALSPPQPAFKSSAANGRGGASSPVRDSRFLEEF